ncbi:hypothetical protein BT63DRAFT_442825 [Microthyrium microscopicum]|uniref:Uncharacterized protein n=1 Tax=Microthyrium microscopicum TaxID=703497 RepID=A0A6A6U388_9PEZI|nr:hypothetical protein BT63DRAFT_442825 [Microthyrium microscopicum]
MVSLSSVISISMWVGPWLIPRALAFYRSIQASNRQPGTVRPTPPHVKWCLNPLYLFIIVSLIRTLPYFTPSNIFRDTSSRLQIPTGVLFSRISALHGGKLTPVESALKSRYAEASGDWTLLYAAYGPEVLAMCPFCNTDSPSTYLWYALPTIVAPHLVHIFLLGLLTSPFFSGPDGARWRTYATIAGVALATIELTMVMRYDWKLNTTKKTANDVDWFFWRLRTMRLLAFAAVDGLLGWGLWLTSTNRWLVKPPAVAEQVNTISLMLQVMNNKLKALGHIQNAVLRDDQLRGAGYHYWTREPRLMEEVEQEREVIDARRQAISHMDYDRVTADADLWVERVWGALKPTPLAGDGTRQKTE